VKHFRARYDVIDVDGVRVLFGDGWGLVRASNTQPVIVARYEAQTPDGSPRFAARWRVAALARRTSVR
jgi:phosphomannomutase/phosphoglucomutase